MSDKQASELVGSGAQTSTLVAANQISEKAKEVLVERNSALRAHWWSWFDRRGELQLNHPDTSGILQFTATTPRQRSRELDSGWLARPASDGPIRGRAGISPAVALLLRPDDSPSVRTIARDAQMSHGAIGESVKRLRHTGLVSSDGSPDIPELFWALAGVWGPTRATPVAGLPTDDDLDRLHANADPASPAPGWCVAGDDVTASWGAPMVTVGHRPWI